jgi:hypothetical protein
MQPETKVHVVGLLKDTLILRSFKVISRMKVSGNYGISSLTSQQKFAVEQCDIKTGIRRSYYVSATEGMLMHRKERRHIVMAGREVW